ncbi:MAG: nucleotidyltransferase domain-containing protein [Pseudomonadota bacterium]
MLKSIGTLVPAKTNGTLPWIGCRPSTHWSAIAHDITQVARSLIEAELISVVLRGSTARNTAVRGASDIDILFVVPGQVQDHLDLTAPTAPTLKVEATALGRDRLMFGDDCSWLRFSLAHAGWVLEGDNVLADLPPARLDRRAAAHLPNYRTWVADLDQHLAESTGPAEDKDICQWIMKRIVRSLFESEMLVLKAYSRDIYPCAKAAAEAYPAQVTNIWQAAEWAVAPSDDVATWKPLVAALTPTLATACARFSAT